MKPTLLFGDPDVERSELLQESFGAHPGLIARATKTPDLMRLVEVDAILLTIMAAERWGARPITHEAQVFATTTQDQDAGWPAFVIAGVAARESDPRNPEFELHLIITAVLEAVRSFNAMAEKPLRSVAFGPEWIGIRKLTPQHAAAIIRAAYDESPE